MILNINEIIKSTKKSKTEIARELNKSKSNLGHILSPKNNPRIFTLIDLSIILDVDFAFFLKNNFKNY